MNRPDEERGSNVVAKIKSGTSDAPEAPDFDGGPWRTRTSDPLIKSDPQSMSTEVHDDVKLEDLYTWD